MAEKRLVECQDCGYRWESGADSPRCAKSDCGRSRNVEPVEDDADDPVEQEPVEDAVDDDLEDDAVEDDADDGEGYTPAFEASTVRTGAERGNPGSSTSTDDEDDDEDDGSSSTDEQPEGPDEVPDIDAEQLKPAIDATFNMLAVSRGEHWKLDDDEAEQLADGWTPVMNHYAPIILKENALIVTAAITSYGVLAPRLAKDRELAEQDERQAVDDEADAGSVRQAVVEDTVEDEQPDEQTPSSNGAAPGGYASV